MKFARLILSLALPAALVGLVGCDTVASNFEGRFQPVPPKVQTYDGDLRQVGHAVVETFKQLDFTVTETSGGLTRLEASSPIRTDATLGDSRQLVAQVTLHEVAAKRIAVEMLLSLQVEDNSRTGRSGQNLREHGFYDTFYTTLAKVLQESPVQAEGPVNK